MKPLRPQRNDLGFTMVEIALAIGILGIALVAIVGVLPVGLNVQKENREDTLIEQEGDYFMEALVNSQDFGRDSVLATGQRRLTNVVDRINARYIDLTSGTVTSDFTYDRDNTAGLVAGWTPRTVIGLLSRPYWTLDTWHTQRVETRAVVRASVGSAMEQTPLFEDFAFHYEMLVRIHPYSSPYELGGDPSLRDQMVSLGPFGLRELARQESLMNNLYEVTLEIRWPVTGAHDGGGAYSVGNNKRVFRRYVSGSLVEDPRSPEMYFFSRYVYRPNPIVDEN